MAGVTPTPALTTFYDGVTLTAAQLGGFSTHAANLFNAAQAGFRTRKPLIVIAGANATIPDSTYTLLSWPTENIDNDGAFTPGGTTMTIKTAGWYRLALQVHHNAAGGGTRTCKIMVNGTNPNTNAVATDNRNPCTIEGTIIFCQCIAKLAAGATITTNTWQNSGNPQALYTGVSGSFFSAEWISPYV